MCYIQLSLCFGFLYVAGLSLIERLVDARHPLFPPFLSFSTFPIDELALALALTSPHPHAEFVNAEKEK